MKNKEKLVRDLVNTFKDRNDLHVAYKNKMKKIIRICIASFLTALDREPDLNVDEWIENFVEKNFKPKE